MAHARLCVHGFFVFAAATIVGVSNPMKRALRSSTGHNSSETESVAAEFLTRAAENELAQRVRLFLDNSNIPALRHVCVKAEGDAIVLSGAVQSYYEKQMAVQFSSRVAGVLRVVDSIVVRTYVPLPKRRSLNRSHASPAP